MRAKSFAMAPADETHNTWRRLAAPAAVVLGTIAVVGLRPSPQTSVSVTAPDQVTHLQEAPRTRSNAAAALEAAESKATTPVRPQLTLQFHSFLLV